MATIVLTAASFAFMTVLVSSKDLQGSATNVMTDNSVINNETNKLASQSNPMDANDKIEADSRRQTNDERRLVEYLMRNYDNNIRPVKDAATPVNIRLGITLTQIFDLDEKNQVLTTNVWLDQEWVDEFLSWNPTDFGNLTKIRIPCEKIWKPDIVLYNSADDYTRGYMNSRAMIEPTGNVFWPPPTKLRSTCPVDVTYFPFDDQKCVMKLGSWIYDGLQVDVLNRTAEVDLTNYVPNGEWDLIEAHLVRNVMQYSCCPEPFPDVTITVVIRRKILYYMYNVILPCMMMSVLTLLVFCLPPDSGEKIALGVTVLLAFSVFMLAISEKLPETSESIPLLGMYLTAVMGITSVSIIMTVIVLNFHYRGPIRKEMPLWIKKLLLDKVSYEKFMNCHKSNSGIANSNQQMGYSWYTSSSSWPFTNSSSNNIFTPQSMPQQSAFKTGSVLSPHLIKSTADMMMLRIAIDADTETANTEPINSTIDDDDLIHKCRTAFHSSTLGMSGDSDNVNNLSPSEQLINKFRSSDTSNINSRQKKCTNSKGKTSFTTPIESKLTSYEELSQILKYLLWRQEIEDYHNRMIHEWRLLALFIDKVLFWIFFVITFVSSLSFLVIIPLQRRGFPF